MLVKYMYRKTASLCLCSLFGLMCTGAGARLLATLILAEPAHSAGFAGRGPHQAACNSTLVLLLVTVCHQFGAGGATIILLLPAGQAFALLE